MLGSYGDEIRTDTTHKPPELAAVAKPYLHDQPISRRATQDGPEPEPLIDGGNGRWVHSARRQAVDPQDRGGDDDELRRRGIVEEKPVRAHPANPAADRAATVDAERHVGSGGRSQPVDEVQPGKLATGSVRDFAVELATVIGLDGRFEFVDQMLPLDPHSHRHLDLSTSKRR